MVHPHGDPAAVVCDAGTLVNGLLAAERNGSLDGVPSPAGASLNRPGYVLTHDIKGYLISHAHLDHVAGLIVDSPDDSAKPVYGLPSVLREIEANYFNWKAWPNFTDHGAAPALKKYAMTSLTPSVATPLQGTRMSVTAFPLRHDAVESTAFLLESGDDAMLYFGDTGPDEVQQVSNLQNVWAAVAERVARKQLKGIIIETSYANDRPDQQLFGHLTPKWLLQSLRALDRQAGGNALRGLPVLVSHIKYSLTSVQPQRQIIAELESGNDLGVRFILPEQGMRLHWQ
jgi:3',5'-cyclic-nucleotide phosphodiesterase